MSAADLIIPELKFGDFTRVLRIDSKERGICELGDCLMGSQFMLLKQIRRGLDEGCHEFITLKARQLGISTISMAIDLFSLYEHRALNAALVTHDEASRDQFRTTLELYRSGLPEEYQRDIVDDNRNQLVAENGSRIRFLVAGTRARQGGSSKLGRSGALLQMHATEVAYWGDPSGIDALRASFAHTNPIRFYHWESTANGENFFKDMWDEAKQSKSVRAIFVGWWANDGYYGLRREDPLYQHYWGAHGRMTREESAITREVKALYDADINDCQWAWYRYMASEKMTDSSLMLQEFPHREHDAFLMTGSAFFRGMTLEAARRIARSRKRLAKYYRVEVGTSFADTTVSPARATTANLIVWEEPAPNAYYAIGVDPAFASSSDSNASAISVWRTWYNRMEQVAEFRDINISTHATAWVFCYLAGHYGRTTVNLEVNGPGMAVLQEFLNLRRQAYAGKAFGLPAMAKVFASIRQYLYRRPDSITGATPAIHTKTTHEIKETMLNTLRDFLEREMLIPSSEALVAEMGSVRRESDGYLGAPGGKTDDLVIGGCLAIKCWNEQMRTMLLAQSIVWKESKQVGVPVADNPTQRVVDKFLTRIGMRPDGTPGPKKRAYPGAAKWSGKLRQRLTLAENGRAPR